MDEIDQLEERFEKLLKETKDTDLIVAYCKFKAKLVEQMEMTETILDNISNFKDG